MADLRKAKKIEENVLIFLKNEKIENVNELFQKIFEFYSKDEIKVNNHVYDNTFLYLKSIKKSIDLVQSICFEKLIDKTNKENIELLRKEYQYLFKETFNDEQTIEQFLKFSKNFTIEQFYENYLALNLAKFNTSDIVEDKRKTTFNILKRVLVNKPPREMEFINKRLFEKFLIFKNTNYPLLKVSPGRTWSIKDVENFFQNYLTFSLIANNTFIPLNKFKMLDNLRFMLLSGQNKIYDTKKIYKFIDPTRTETRQLIEELSKNISGRGAFNDKRTIDEKDILDNEISNPSKGIRTVDYKNGNYFITKNSSYVIGETQAIEEQINELKNSNKNSDKKLATKLEEDLINIKKVQKLLKQIKYIKEIEIENVNKDKVDLQKLVEFLENLKKLEVSNTKEICLKFRSIGHRGANGVYFQANYSDNLNPEGEIPNSPMIVLSTKTSETKLHELIHHLHLTNQLPINIEKNVGYFSKYNNYTNPLYEKKADYYGSIEEEIARAGELAYALFAGGFDKIYEAYKNNQPYINEIGQEIIITKENIYKLLLNNDNNMYANPLKELIKENDIYFNIETMFKNEGIDGVAYFISQYNSLFKGKKLDILPSTTIQIEHVIENNNRTIRNEKDNLEFLYEYLRMNNLKEFSSILDFFDGYEYIELKNSSIKLTLKDFSEDILSLSFENFDYFRTKKIFDKIKEKQPEFYQKFMKEKKELFLKELENFQTKNVFFIPNKEIEQLNKKVIFLLKNGLLTNDEIEKYGIYNKNDFLEKISQKLDLEKQSEKFNKWLEDNTIQIWLDDKLMFKSKNEDKFLFGINPDNKQLYLYKNIDLEKEGAIIEKQPELENYFIYNYDSFENTRYNEESLNTIFKTNGKCLTKIPNISAYALKYLNNINENEFLEKFKTLKLYMELNLPDLDIKKHINGKTKYFYRGNFETYEKDIKEILDTNMLENIIENFTKSVGKIKKEQLTIQKYKNK